MATRMVGKLGGPAVVKIAGLLLGVFALVPDTARADGVRASSCVGAGGAFSCVTQWSHGPASAQFRSALTDPREAADVAERERKWVARCRPVIKQDQFGIGRYHYAAPGCEFGKNED